ncbi:MAG: GMC family oxidoreductase N-terminal domain-containing protein [Methanosphaera sp.]|uniref:GMC family oxidoreductase N-terminal domain-containing protein n=1 Tax=Methanosphaera sp. TaxID=2666342 RepID=UPI0025F077E1|nr:GMC family oxidoreductase N-terminal domain-containing protein [Methanosphaera sp.]MCI5867606.1 GMC family oxidoreductase N-terminal domain-containing protein [Methanosphaera sp.]MDD6534073.1 GMC family oxidoreductase N-terminal domain-containing protein [Methanosphaera sp.]MDY3956117.1 GMC family oxidoreductase N-terminal domain-containing protein [Methanosphaera sp.]
MTKVIIIGAGTGGLSVAKELSKNKDAEVLIIEKGPLADTKDAYKYYDTWDRNEMEIIKTTLVGGSSTVIAGNFIPSFVEELKKYDIDITKQLDELKDELKIAPMPESHIGDADHILQKAAEELGFDMQPMPKAIDATKCKQCGKCAWGCPHGAKWSSLEDLKIAQQNGAKLITDEEVVKLLVEDSKIKGVVTNKANTYTADIVVVAAGGVVTPKLLRLAGINTAGETFAVDPFITIGGYYKGANQTKQIEMNKFIKLPYAVISPHTSQYVLDGIKQTHPDATADDVLSFMIKIPDNRKGKVYANKVEKSIDYDDVAYIAQASAIAGAILKQAGVDMESISSTHTRGAHLIATSPVGEVVDSNLQTEIENLYVADGSVLPKAEGIPPIYAILAIAKRLGQHLADII